MGLPCAAPSRSAERLALAPPVSQAVRRVESAPEQALRLAVVLLQYGADAGARKGPGSSAALAYEVGGSTPLHWLAAVRNIAKKGLEARARARAPRPATPGTRR